MLIDIEFWLLSRALPVTDDALLHQIMRFLKNVGFQINKSEYEYADLPLFSDLIVKAFVFYLKVGPILNLMI